MNKSPKMVDGGTLSSRNKLLMSKLVVFYNNKKNIDELLPIINGNTELSLRIIDWFVTNYCKKHNITYYLKNGENDTDSEQFIVWLRYKMQLKSFLKKQFDPFCRRERICFFYNNGNDLDHIITTIGQLNFFKWAIDNLVIDYIKQNMDAIEVDMNQSYNSIKKNKKESKNTRKQRQELSKSGSRGLSRNNIDVVLSFN